MREVVAVPPAVATVREGLLAPAPAAPRAVHPGAAVVPEAAPGRGPAAEALRWPRAGAAVAEVPEAAEAATGPAEAAPGRGAAAARRCPPAGEAAAEVPDAAKAATGPPPLLCWAGRGKVARSDMFPRLRRSVPTGDSTQAGSIHLYLGC